MNHRDARKAFLLSMMVSVLMLVSLPSYANTGPSTLIQTIANNMLAGLKANKATLKTKPQVVYHLAYKYIVPYAALSEMAKHVLPPSIWNSATPAQRTQFEREFTTTLIRTYASSLTAYQDQTIQVFPVRGGYDGQRTVEVNSEIDSPTSQSIQVSYRLIRMGSEWKLYDLSVEGVSMLESFRAQFADLLSQGNMEQLLNQMSHHNNR
jgi:phospholipid transport system substrate-binding protein